MKLDIAVVNRGFRELNPLLCGFEDCKSGYSFGPYIREYYLIHYVRSGKGVFCNRSGRYEVKAGQIFIIYPDQLTTYTADKQDPWSYIWVGFDGCMAKRLEELNACVLNYREDTFYKLLLGQKMENTREEFIAGQLFVLFAYLFEKNTLPPSYEQQITDYILSNYMREVKIEEIAQMIGLDRRYMTRIFKKSTGLTVQEFLIQTRLDSAVKYLKQGNSVADSAMLSGYTDVFHFSKSFKKRYGCSPKKYMEDAADKG